MITGIVIGMYPSDYEKIKDDLAQVFDQIKYLYDIRELEIRSEYVDASELERAVGLISTTLPEEGYGRIKNDKTFIYIRKNKHKYTTEEINPYLYT